MPVRPHTRSASKSGAQDSPKTVQEAPKTAQEAPKSVHEAPKTAQDRSQNDVWHLFPAFWGVPGGFPDIVPAMGGAWGRPGGGLGEARGRLREGLGALSIFPRPPRRRIKGGITTSLG